MVSLHVMNTKPLWSESAVEPLLWARRASWVGAGAGPASGPLCRWPRWISELAMFNSAVAVRFHDSFLKFNHFCEFVSTNHFCDKSRLQWEFHNTALNSVPGDASSCWWPARGRGQGWRRRRSWAPLRGRAGAPSSGCAPKLQWSSSQSQFLYSNGLLECSVQTCKQMTNKILHLTGRRTFYARVVAPHRSTGVVRSNQNNRSQFFPLYALTTINDSLTVKFT